MTRRTMTFAYIFALALIAITACAGYLGIRLVVGHVSIHQAAMQKMAEQESWTNEVVLQARKYVKSTTPEEKAVAEANLLDFLNRLSSRHNAMAEGRFDEFNVDMSDPEIHRAYFLSKDGLDPLISQYEEEIRQLIELEKAEDIDTSHPHAKRVLEETPRRILAQLNKVVTVHKNASQERVDWALQLGGLLVAGLVVLLILEGLFIFHPMTHQIDEKQKALEAANARLERIATYDHLTQVFNRTKFPEIAERERARALREKEPLGCVMLDIDHFKKVNDTHGHATGDLVLRHLADILKSETRGVDYVLRWGGEEFLILMPGNTLEACKQAAEKLRRDVEANPAREDLAVTISLGVTVTDGTEDLNLVVERSDAALYDAKESGRNRVVAISG